MNIRCEVCKQTITPTDSYKKLELIQGPIKEETVYVHLDCYSPKLLESVNIKLNDRCI